MAGDSPALQRRLDAWPRGLKVWTGALAAAVAATTLHPEFESDPFWHMTLGRAVLAHHSRVVPEPSAFEAFNQSRAVPEWLWGVITLQLGDPGGVGAAVFVVLLAVAATFATVRLLERWAPPPTIAPLVLISGLVMTMVSMRLRLRPESAAFVLLPVLLERCIAFGRAEGKPRRRIAIALVAMEILWAQLHGSFVIVPVLFAATRLEDWARGRARSERKLDAVVFAALCVALGSSAYGLDVGRYLAIHLSGDARAHVGDWRPLVWSDFAPSSWLDGPWGGPYGAVLALMSCVLVVGVATSRSFDVSAAALAVTGLGLMTSGTRFMAMGTLLMGPLIVGAARSVFALFAHRSRLAVGGAAFLGLGAVALQAKGLHESRGPLFALGLEQGSFPTGARAYLDASDANVNVLTDYSAGAPLSYWLGPRVRTFVDARTPLHFDDTDFALSRDAMRSATTMFRVAERHRVDLAVVVRTAGSCAALAQEWTAVVVEPRFTTFARAAPSGRRLTMVKPCGADYLAVDACREDGAALDADIEAISPWVAPAFASYLRAERILRCGGSADRAVQLLPQRHDARAFLAARNRAAAAGAMATGRPADALLAVREELESGDLASLAIVRNALTDARTPPAEAREILAAIEKRLDDRTPADVRALTAVACAELGDVECARFEALRAWAGGSVLATPTMKWLAANHPSPSVRADVAAWLELPPLRARAPSVVIDAVDPGDVPDGDAAHGVAPISTAKP